MKLTLRKSEWLDDWYLIERAEHDGRTWLEKTGPSSSSVRCSSRFSDADVEGDSGEMMAIAKAIECRGRAGFKRCAVDATGDPVLFRSPRNSERDGECSPAEADELAAEIRRVLTP